jgi:hypothetical protein
MLRYHASSIQVQWLASEVWGAGKLRRSFEKEVGIKHWSKFAGTEKGAEEDLVDGKL